MSDLHLETPRFLPMYTAFQVEPAAPYLALLGDIGSVHDERLFHFLEMQLEQFEIVFYVLGNHEPYAPDNPEVHQAATWEGALARMRQFEAKAAANMKRDAPLGRFLLLDRRRFDLSDTLTILGCTLFSNVVDSQRGTVSLFVSDFSNITDWTVETHNVAHKSDLSWLNGEVETIARHEPHRRVIVLTHYSPTSLPEANDPEHLEDSRGVQTAFVTNLDKEPCWTSPVVKVWAFGHTHFNCDFVDAKTGKRVVANQRGYGREDIFDFDAGKVVDI